MMATTTTTCDALNLLQQLKNYVVQKNEIVESLTTQLRSLKDENEKLINEIKIRDSKCSCGLLGTPERDKEMSCLSIATHGESTSYDIVSIQRDNSKLSPESLSKKLQHSSTRRSHRGENMDQLSVDLREKVVQILENKYGGKEEANNAALVIQHCYRRWIMHKSFKRMRAFSGRNNSLTKLPSKHFEKLKQTSLLFYGPENPVMIVDDSKEQSMFLTHRINEKQPPKTLATSSPVPEKKVNISKETAVELKPEMLDKVLTSTQNEPNENNNCVADEERIINNIEAEEKVIEVIEEEGTYSDETEPVTEISLQYDIIDDAQVLTVEEKHVDLQDGSSFPVDKIHGDEIDGSCVSEDNYLQDTASKFAPTFDKSMHKRQFRIGVNLFNWKPEVGIGYLTDNGLMEGDIKSIADFFRRETMISKQKISEYFGNLRNDFNMKVLYEFATSFDYVGKDVDEALRQFQSYFKLTGEAQTVEKFLQVFAERYVECNPGRLSDNPDTILLLAFALAMLNTDLHNQNVKRRMTLQEFLKNLRGTDNGNDLNQEMLTNMYSRIQKNEFATGADHTTQLHQIENSFIGKVPNIAASHRQFVKLFTVEQVYDPNRRDKPHSRLAFLFNDLLLLAKPRGKSSTHGSGHVFSCKASYSLLDKRVAEFSNEHYSHGVLLLGKFDKKVIATFNTKDEKTRHSLVEELDEYMRETNGIESIRITLTQAKKTNALHMLRSKDERTKSLVIDNTAKVRSMETVEASSLTDLRPLHDKDGYMMTSSSMGNINETPDEDFDKIVRTNSASSLDASVMSPANPNDKVVVSSTPKSLFGNLVPKFRKSTSSLSYRNDSERNNSRETITMPRDKRASSSIGTRNRSSFVET